MDFATLASASFLSREDRRAYLKAIEAEERKAAQRNSQQVKRKPAAR